MFSLSAGWLEPLLARIAEGKQHVVTPVIETIKDDDLTLRGTPAKNIFVGKFNWQLTFDWMPRPSNYDRNDPQALIKPVRWVYFSNRLKLRFYYYFFFYRKTSFLYQMMFHMNILFLLDFWLNNPDLDCLNKIKCVPLLKSQILLGNLNFFDCLSLILINFTISIKKKFSTLSS